MTLSYLTIAKIKNANFDTTIFNKLNSILFINMSPNEGI